MTLSRRYPVSRDRSVSGVIVEAERTRRPRASSLSWPGMCCGILAGPDQPGHHLSGGKWNIVSAPERRANTWPASTK